MSEENSPGSNLIWAAALIIIAAIIASTIYYSGILNGTEKHRINLKTDVPASR